jgi:hypothetical protein
MTGPRSRRVKNPNWLIDNVLKTKYGLKPGEYEEMLIRQSGRCEICSEPMRKPNIDHNHITKIVRALLCGGCNTGVGYFKEDPARMVAAAAYIRRFNLPI